MIPRTIHPDVSTAACEHTAWGWLSDAIRRVIDLTLASGGLILTVPLLVACCGWVRFVDGGPVLYRQWRVGRGGWLFRIYKLRTMVLDAERDQVPRFASKGDGRILPGCAWMRKSHVDELPQLVNVLTGQMSLVGPRPERPEVMEHLYPAIPRIERRLAVRPGLTGLAQLEQGYANDARGSRLKMAYDLRYLRRRSLRADVWLMFRTLPKVWDRASL
jgi:lipopolysaccharide/colanic/teichoic acid biosynthesis glycosyltransferase